jgi:hypothetical protein
VPVVFLVLPVTVLFPKGSHRGNHVERGFDNRDSSIPLDREDPRDSMRPALRRDDVDANPAPSVKGEHRVPPGVPGHGPECQEAAAQRSSVSRRSSRPARALPTPPHLRSLSVPAVANIAATRRAYWLRGWSVGPIVNVTESVALLTVE